MGIENKIVQKCQVRLDRSRPEFIKFIFRSVRKKLGGSWSTFWTSLEQLILIVKIIVLLVTMKVMMQWMRILTLRKRLMKLIL